ncbi:MAG: S8 family serine peptidase [Pseudobacteriovorax sp.]|nr:S8 family serine peptidase [Pseudobacteriovorax sp.]
MVKALLLLVISAAFALSCAQPSHSLRIQKQSQNYHLLVDHQLIHVSQKQISKFSTVQLEGDTLAATWSEYDQGKETLYYAERWQDDWQSARQIDTSLRYTPPSGDAKTTGEGDASILVVSMRIPMNQNIWDWMTNHRIEILHYLPSHNYIVSDRDGHLKTLLETGVIQSKSIYPNLWKATAKGLRSFGATEYYILPFKDQQMEPLIAGLKAMGIPVPRFSDAGWIEAFLRPDQIDRLMKWPEIMQMIPNNDPIGLDMDMARKQGGADFLESKTPEGLAFYTGIGVRGHVLEGINPNHRDFSGNEFRDRPIAVLNGTPSGHGHQAFGVIFGNGAGNEKAKGILPNAQGYYTNYDAIYYKNAGPTVKGGRYELTKRVIEENGIMFQTASWGHGTTREYTIRSREMDRIIFDLDLPIMQSQSNSGNPNSRPQAWAKNIVSVGGLFHFETSQTGDDRWDAGRFDRASIGPAIDGRIKPDLVGYMDSTETTSVEGGYAQFGGTSGATPIVAGYMGLILEMWQRGNFSEVLDQGGNELIEQSSQLPHASTAKALLIHSAKPYPFSDRKDDLSRFHQGWGFPDIKALYKIKDNLTVIDESLPLRPQERLSRSISVEEGQRLLLATLVYRDPPAVVGSEFALVNDLTLRLTAPNGDVYWGNYGLKDGNESQPNGVADSIDTVERVILARPAPGEWKVEVIASEINLDSHLETEDIDAAFSLVTSVGIE